MAYGGFLVWVIIKRINLWLLFSQSINNTNTIRSSCVGNETALKMLLFFHVNQLGASISILRFPGLCELRIVLPTNSLQLDIFSRKDD